MATVRCWRQMWRGNRSRAALQGPQVDRESALRTALRRSLSAPGCSRGRPRGRKSASNSQLQRQIEPMRFPPSDTTNCRIRHYLSSLSSAVSVCPRTSSLSLDELFYILRGSRIIESLYHSAQQQVFLEQPLLSSQSVNCGA